MKLTTQPLGMTGSRYSRLRSCQQKVRYSRGKARRLAFFMKQRVYECDYCGGFHLTTRKD